MSLKYKPASVQDCKKIASGKSVGFTDYDGTPTNLGIVLTTQVLHLTPCPTPTQRERPCCRGAACRKQKS